MYIETDLLVSHNMDGGGSGGGGGGVDRNDDDWVFEIMDNNIFWAVEAKLSWLRMR